MKGLLIFLSGCIAVSIQQDICLTFLGECIPNADGSFSCPTVQSSQLQNASDTTTCLPNNANPGTDQCCEISPIYANCKDATICAGAITNPSQCSDGEKKTCPLSCQSCDYALGLNSSTAAPTPAGNTNASCVDADPNNCPVAANEGGCSQSFYQQNCPKSCGLCTASGSGTPSPSSSTTCVDADPSDCAKSAAMGSCSLTFYQQQCPKSCGLC